jgi:hypothetical protein
MMQFLFLLSVLYFLSDLVERKNSNRNIPLSLMILQAFLRFIQKFKKIYSLYFTHNILTILAPLIISGYFWENFTETSGFSNKFFLPNYHLPNKNKLVPSTAPVPLTPLRAEVYFCHQNQNRPITIWYSFIETSFQVFASYIHTLYTVRA